MSLQTPPGRRTVRHRYLIGAAVMVACAALVWVAVAVAPTTNSSKNTGGSCALSQISTSSQPACWRPFAANSLFNTRLPTNPKLAPESAAIVHRMVSSGWTVDGSNRVFAFSPREYGTRPVFFATSSDPVMTIRCKVNDSFCTGANGISVAGMRIHVPAGAVPFANSDAHMTVIEQATGQEYDFWNASVSGSTISARTAAVVNVRSGDGRGSQGDAALFGLTAGLVRPSELTSGTIDHALVVTVPCTSGYGQNVGYVWPANGGWGSACGPNGGAADDHAPATGQLLRLKMTDAQIRASSAPSWQKTIMTALAHYGAYVEDTDGSAAEGIDIIMQASSSWTDVGQGDQWAPALQRFGSVGGDLVSKVPLPVSDFEIVDPCVPHGTCTGGDNTANR